MTKKSFLSCFTKMEELLIVGVCILLNAILSATEMAFISVGRPELRAYAAQGNKRALLLLSLRQNPERILSVLQIGITLVGAIAAAVSGAGAGEVIQPYLQNQYGFSAHASETLSILVIVIPLTYMNVVFGELIPKAISLKKPHTIALVAAPWLRAFDNFLSPIVSLLERSTKLVIRLFFNSVNENLPPTEDILELQNLGKKTKQYILNLVLAEKRKAQDVMVPWASVNSLDKSWARPEVEKVILNSRHTRLPVTSGENVIGVIHSKEFLVLLESGDPEWQRLVRPILQVKNWDTLLNIFLKLQETRSHLAVIYDRLNPIGIITLEDIVEEIMGDLYSDDDDDRIKRLLSHRVRK